MKIGWWNIRGFSKALKHKTVYSFLKDNGLAMFALLETKLDDGRLLEIVQLKFPQWRVLHNFDEHLGGRIVVFWNPVDLLVELVGADEQVLNTHVTCLVTKRKFFASFVYGKHSIVARRPLWDTLR